MHATPSTSSDNQEEKKKTDERADGNSNEDQKKEDSSINEENSIYTRKRVHNPKAYLLAQKEVYKSAQQLDFTYVLRRNSKKNKVSLMKFLIRSIILLERPRKSKSL